MPNSTPPRPCNCSYYSLLNGTQRANSPYSSIECPPGQQSSAHPTQISCDDGSIMKCYQCEPFIPNHIKIQGKTKLFGNIKFFIDPMGYNS